MNFSRAGVDIDSLANRWRPFMPGYTYLSNANPLAACIIFLGFIAHLADLEAQLLADLKAQLFLHLLRLYRDYP